MQYDTSKNKIAKNTILQIDNNSLLEQKINSTYVPLLDKHIISNPTILHTTGLVEASIEDNPMTSAKSGVMLPIVYSYEYSNIFTIPERNIPLVDFTLQWQNIKNHSFISSHMSKEWLYGEDYFIISGGGAWTGYGPPSGIMATISQDIIDAGFCNSAYTREAEWLESYTLLNGGEITVNGYYLSSSLNGGDFGNEDRISYYIPNTVNIVNRLYIHDDIPPFADQIISINKYSLSPKQFFIYYDTEHTTHLRVAYTDPEDGSKPEFWDGQPTGTRWEEAPATVNNGNYPEPYESTNKVTRIPIIKNETSDIIPTWLKISTNRWLCKFGCSTIKYAPAEYISSNEIRWEGTAGSLTQKNMPLYSVIPEPMLVKVTASLRNLVEYKKTSMFTVTKS